MITRNIVSLLLIFRWQVEEVDQALLQIFLMKIIVRGKSTIVLKIIKEIRKINEYGKEIINKDEYSVRMMVKLVKEYYFASWHWMAWVSKIDDNLQIQFWMTGILQTDNWYYCYRGENEDYVSPAVLL